MDNSDEKAPVETLTPGPDLDEAEARRRRVLERKQNADKKWNFAGKTNNVVNDRTREHEVELQKRRVLAYRSRQFRGGAEDEGDEAQEKMIRKQLAEVNAEKGFVKPKPREGFAFLPSREEFEDPRQLALRFGETGAGIDLTATWWGMVVTGIDSEPGQPGLRVGDTITEISGTSLMELEAEDCELRWADLFGDGCVATVECHVVLVGALHSKPVDEAVLRGDVDRFANDWVVDIKVDGDCSGGDVHFTVEGSQTAIRQVKQEFERLMTFYCT